MAPIDPNELLKAFRPLLTRKGGIKNRDEVPRLSGLMRKFSKKLVSRCIYCNILLATDCDVLESFLVKDGWDIVNGWLKDAKRESNFALLVELLKLLDICPMSVDRLKQNDTAKVVKLLAKCENENVAEKSKAVVEKWMQIIKENNDKLQKDEIKKKRKKEHIERERAPSIDDSNDIKKLKKSNEEDRNMQDGSNSADSMDGVMNHLGVAGEISFMNTVPVIKKAKLPAPERAEHRVLVDSTVNSDIKLESRASTVKIRYGKARSIGFDNKLPQQGNPKPTQDLKSVDTSKGRSVTSSSFNEMSINKSVKHKPNEMLNESVESKASGVKLIDPKPMTPNSLNNKICTIKESASFMDAITHNTSDRSQAKKKRRLLGGASRTRDEERSERSDSFDSKADDDDETVTGDEEEDVEDEEVPEMSEIEKQIEAELSGGAVIIPEEDDDIADTENFDEPFDVTGDNSEPMPPTIFYTPQPVLKPILCYGTKFNKPKKSVKWVADESIKEVRFFELDETERTNVSRPFGEYRALEMKNERQALLSAKRGTMITPPERAPIEYFPWFLIFIDFQDKVPITEPGKMSREKIVQAERQMNILPEFYPSRELAPDFPQEPEIFEALAASYEAPKIIPLEDENNPQVVDFSNVQLPKPINEELPMRSPVPHFQQYIPPNIGMRCPPFPPMPGAFVSSFPDPGIPAYDQVSPPGQRNGPPMQFQPFNNFGNPPPQLPQQHPPSRQRHRNQNSYNDRKDRSRSRRVCKFWAKNKTCKFQDCNFAHTSPNESNRVDYRDKSFKNERNHYNNNNNNNNSFGANNTQSVPNEPMWGNDWSSNVNVDAKMSSEPLPVNNSAAALSDGWD